MRRVPVDGGLLLFDRDSGWNTLLDGTETAHLRLGAPRVVQLGLTNRCNLACHFCSRDTSWSSDWTADTLVELLRELAAAGVLEVAFGGGEPLAFPGFAELVRRLYDETPLAISFTTNGLALRAPLLDAVAGRFGQIRLSLYDDVDWRARVQMLADRGARFGVNFLVFPDRLRTLDDVVLELVALGCKDILLLSYNGTDRALHLSPPQSAELAARVRLLGRALRGRAELKLDVCWGDRMESVPRLFAKADCGAGREFVVVTSDRHVMPCSFHHVRVPIRFAADVMDVWRQQSSLLATAAREPGCARTPGYGLTRSLEVVP